MSKKFEALTKFIPDLEKGEFGNWVPGSSEPDGSFSLGFFKYNEISMKFIKAAYKFYEQNPEYESYSDILKQNGIQWEEKSMISADEKGLDEKCVCALIIGAVRADRFCDGAFQEFLKNGSVVRWLKRLQEIDNMEKKTITIQKISITDVGTDAIVNAANEHLSKGVGVCGAIFKAAGETELQKECNKIGHCDTGSAVITPGYKLSKYIIHAVGPRWGSDENKVKQKLYGCYRKALELAVENGCKSIGFPLISSGVFAVPTNIAWRKALQACLDFKDDIKIVFAVLDDDTLEEGKKTLAGLNGISQDPHEERIAIFNDTMDWIEQDPDLSASVAKAQKNTEIIWENDYPDFDRPEVKEQITVTTHRSYEAAMLQRKKYPDAKIAVLNFANAFRAGGGVTSGAGAQEESLCRCSTLYPVISQDSVIRFYEHHHKLHTSKASDSMIYTEGVVICKTDDSHPQRMLKEDWVKVDVMTLAAPDLRKKSNPHAPLVGNGTYMNNAELFGYHVKRAIHMLTIAASKNADILVLGAFGCGAFENDPKVVAHAYKVALQEFPRVFKVVEFAVGGKGDNYNAFKAELG